MQGVFLQSDFFITVFWVNVYKDFLRCTTLYLTCLKSFLPSTFNMLAMNSTFDALVQNFCEPVVT
uniref:Uncharacterized protein n=1 Tax=Manihot esculenta TaxID=3983 RepID=A0A2C9V4W7_MANES